QSQYIAYRDTINNEETIRKMADLRTEYEVGQKQAEVDLANAEKEAQAKQALIVGGGLSVVLFLIGIIAFIQYRNNQQKKATNQILRHQKGELETQKTQLEALNSTKDRFFSIISHDLRGPVNAFFGVSKLIKMYVSKGKVNEITEIAEDIDESVSKLSGLLDNLLDWAVQQQGQFPNVPEKVNFNEMTNDLIQVFDTMAKSKNIELINDLPDKVELFVDKNSTMTIFRNLLNNALKFTEEGGSVTFHGELDKETAILKVTDTGVGIPADKLKKLFTLNEKKSTWGTAGEKGLGLGLQLAYEFAEMNKGAIEVESEEGVGTSFIVKLPVFETEDVKSE
ncbi:MAG: HAMP domain-containing histidine kinase, partial [bacterium]|nr:HAMP domain-containing histidine kinase [bacterium]